MGDKTTFEYAAKMDSKAAAEHLSRLADAVSGRSFEIVGLGKSINLHVDNTVRLELKATSKADEGEIQLQISWKAENTAPPEKLEITPIVGAEDSNQE